MREKENLWRQLIEGRSIFKRLQYTPCRPGGPCRPSGPCAPGGPCRPVSPLSPLLPGTPSRPSRPGSPSRPSLPRGPWTVYILAVLIELPLVVLSCVNCTLLSSLGRAPAGWRREGVQAGQY